MSPAATGPQATLRSGTERLLQVDGARIRCEVLPATGPGLPALFVHGGGANAAWWHPLLGHLRRDHRWTGAAGIIELSGHGGSDWRARYSSEGWAREVAAMGRELFGGRCALVGHSMGGALACTVAARRMVDAPVTVSLDGNPAGPPAQTRQCPPGALPRVRHYATRVLAVEAFTRRKPHWAPGLAHVVGRRSLIRDPEGWRMQRDPKVFTVPVDPVDLYQLAFPEADCPTVDPDPAHEQRQTLMVLGGQSPFLQRDQSMITPLAAPPGSALAIQVLPGLGHELLMEDPPRVAAALTAALKGNSGAPHHRAVH